jgi:hypothetical protein
MCRTRSAAQAAGIPAAVTSKSVPGIRARRHRVVAVCNRDLAMLVAAGLVDRIQITVFPVIAAQTRDEPVFAGAGDFDLDLLEARTLDGRTQELVYRPTLRTRPAS